MNGHKLPQADSIQELARFRDEHDLTDSAEELEEVPEPVFDRGADFTVHLESAEADALRQIASARGVDPAALLHEWIRERLCG